MVYDDLFQSTDIQEQGGRQCGDDGHLKRISLLITQEMLHLTDVKLAAKR